MDEDTNLTSIAKNLQQQDGHLSALQSELEKNSKKLALKPFKATFERVMMLAELQHQNQLHILAALKGGDRE